MTFWKRNKTSPLAENKNYITDSMRIGTFWRKPALFSKYSGELSNHMVFSETLPFLLPLAFQQGTVGDKFAGGDASFCGHVLPCRLTSTLSGPCSEPLLAGNPAGTRLPGGWVPSAARSPFHLLLPALAFSASAAHCLPCAWKIPGLTLILPFPLCTQEEWRDYKRKDEEERKEGQSEGGREKVLDFSCSRGL